MTTYLSPPKLDARKLSHRGNKLSAKGKELVLKCILLGDSNKEIIAGLKKDGLLDADDSLTGRALEYYRSKKRMDYAKLSEAAREAAHTELSESVLGLTSIARTARLKLLEHEQGQVKLNAGEIQSLAEIQLRSLRIALKTMGLAEALVPSALVAQNHTSASAEDALRRWKRRDRAIRSNTAAARLLS